MDGFRAARAVNGEFFASKIAKDEAGPGGFLGE
jgi:hypothetical protein